MGCHFAPVGSRNPVRTRARRRFDMRTNTVTLVVGLAGIVATLCSSGMGLYYIARARRSPMRELLYARQIDVVVRILRTIAKRANVDSPDCALLVFRARTGA